MINNKEKIIAKDQWEEKFLREALWMPFGSMCNLVGQSFQGKGISKEELDKVTRKIFELAMEFTEEAFKRVRRGKEEEGPEI